MTAITRGGGNSSSSEFTDLESGNSPLGWKDPWFPAFRWERICRCALDPCEHDGKRGINRDKKCRENQRSVPLPRLWRKAANPPLHPLHEVFQCNYWPFSHDLGQSRLGGAGRGRHGVQAFGLNGKNRHLRIGALFTYTAQSTEHVV